MGEIVSAALFLRVDRVVKGGSVGKGSAVSGVSDAEVVFFVKGLPVVGHEKWLPPLLKSVCGVLAEKFVLERCVEGLRTMEDSVQLRVKNLVTIDLRFSPVFLSYAHTVQILGEQGPDVRKYYTT